MSISTWVGSFTPRNVLPSWLSGSVIRADGWSADAVSTPPSTVLDTNDLNVTRLGFNSLGNPTTYSDTIYVTRRIRQPGSTSLDPVRIGLSEYIFAGDTVTGLTNNSTVDTPPPAANWAMLDRDVVSNTLPDLEVSAMHYFGVPVLVRFSITDGVNPPITFDATTPVPVKRGGDQQHILVFRWPAPDISTLNNGVIVVNARVFPRIGVSSSIRDSATTGFAWWEFAHRHFIKDTKRVNDTWQCTVDSATGNDTTGLWSQTLTGADATPFLTITGAIASAKRAGISAGNFLPSASLDGTTIWIKDGTYARVNESLALPTRGGAVRLTRHPSSTSRDTVSLSITGGNCRFNLAGGLPAGMPGGAVRFVDMTVTRTTTHGFIGEPGARLSLQFQNISLNAGNQNAFWLGSNGNCMAFGDNVFVSGMVAGSGAFTTAAGAGWGLMRGFTGDLNAGSSNCYNIIGCKLARLGSLNSSTEIGSVRNVTIQGNYFHSTVDTTVNIIHGQTTNVNVYARWNNIFEQSGTSNTAGHRLSGDGDAGSTYAVYIFHETFAGWDFYNRHNDRYVDLDTGSSPTRTHTVGRITGCLMTSYNTKHDLFNTPNPVRIGGWSVAFGSGFDYNLTQFRDAGAGAWGPEYSGRNSLMGVSNTVQQNPLFVLPRHVTAGPSAGLGDGDYRLQSGSPCKNRTFNRIFVPFDADGNARNIVTSIGAFV